MTESDTPGIFKVVSRFTQSDLNEKRLFYEHTHPFADLYMNDSFIFNAWAPSSEPLLNKVNTNHNNVALYIFQFFLFVRNWTSTFRCHLVVSMRM